MTKTLIAAAVFVLGFSASAFAADIAVWPVLTVKVAAATPVARPSGLDYTKPDRTIVGQNGYGLEQFINDTDGEVADATSDTTDDGIAAAEKLGLIGRDEQGRRYWRNMCPVDASIIGDDKACIGSAFNSLSLLQGMDTASLMPAARNGALSQYYTLSSQIDQLQIQISGHQDPTIRDAQVADLLSDLGDLKIQLEQVRTSLKQRNGTAGSGLSGLNGGLMSIDPMYRLATSPLQQMDRFGNRYQ